MEIEQRKSSILLHEREDPNIEDTEDEADHSTHQNVQNNSTEAENMNSVIVLLHTLD
jgi:hypothetical protein